MLSFEGESFGTFPNTAFLFHGIKHQSGISDHDYPEDLPEALSYDFGRASSIQRHGVPVESPDVYSQNTVTSDHDFAQNNEESTYFTFASFLDSTLQGMTSSQELILKFESACRSASESIRSETNTRHRVLEEKLMRQNERLFIDEAGSWSLLWHLYGKGNEDLPEHLLTCPTTSYLEAYRFVMNDHTTQLCHRIVTWLEEMFSKALDLEDGIRGSHVAKHLTSAGVWTHTQRFLKKGGSNANTVHHLDFDAPTRENAQQLPDDKKQDESVLEDVWTLLKAGRLEEACDICRTAGQPWRAATLRPFGVDDLLSTDGLNVNSRIIQAIELESGIGRQYSLWKWASYCASEKIAESAGSKYEVAVFASKCSNLKRVLPVCDNWESACWAMAKSWLDFQVDMQLTKFQPGKAEYFRSLNDDNSGSLVPLTDSSFCITGAEGWPLHVLPQQPHDLAALLRKLHSRDVVHEAVVRECKDKHKQIQMNLMIGDIPHLMDLIWSWISPSEGSEDIPSFHGDPHMIRFGAHLVLVLRYLLEDEIRDTFREKIMTIGDYIIRMYIMFLFSKKHEELVGIYTSQLAHHRCVDLFVQMMELRLHSSVHVKYKIFCSAVEYLPFFSWDNSKGSFEEIIDRVLSRSREIKSGKLLKSSDVVEQHQLQSIDKAITVQWLCFKPPTAIKDFETVLSNLLHKALTHSNILFREFALISMWRVPTMPTGPHKLLSFLAEPLKQINGLLLYEVQDVSLNLREFQDWNEYYSCDATYRNWINYEEQNAEVPADKLSNEEKQLALTAAKETLNTSLLLLQRKENPWMTFIEDHNIHQEAVFIQLHATAMLRSPSGECICPDATLCATLMSALYSCVSEEVTSNRELMVNVSISKVNSSCIELALRCLAVEGDGIGPHEDYDGGLLSSVISSGFKGEFVRFQAGVTLEISRIDAWYSGQDDSIDAPATYIIWGLCRRCCIPELILRCMQVSVSLMVGVQMPEIHEELIELVASSEYAFLRLFSHHQLQELLLLEREFAICEMELSV